MQKEIRKTKAYYDKHAAEWTDKKTNSFHHEAEFAKLVKLLPKKGSVIDIGCAYGIHVPLFLGIGRSLTYCGIDISSAFLKIARRRYPQLSFIEANIADRTTLPKKKFDGFIAAAVLMHIPFEHWDEMFSNIEYLTKSGARGYLALPVVHPSGDAADSDPRHFTLLSEKEQKKYLRSRNWKIIASGTKDGFSKKGVWRWYIVELPKK